MGKNKAGPDCKPEHKEIISLSSNIVFPLVNYMLNDKFVSRTHTH